MAESLGKLAERLTLRALSDRLRDNIDDLVVRFESERLRPKAPRSVQ